MAEYGYAGLILRVDLSTGVFRKTPTAEFARLYLGGRGIAARIYWNEAGPDSPALSAENRLIFASGPLAGFPGLAGSRWVVCGKSPAIKPERFSYSNFGGSWGATLKFAGYDALVLSGKSEKPAYLIITDGKAQLMDASHLWGKSATETRDLIKAEHGKSARVVACGPAGENCVRFATLLADSDASGSAGFGAVMGYKKLKAICVLGTGRIAAHDAEALGIITRQIAALKAHATGESFDKMMKTMPLPIPMKKDACFGCIQGCVRAISAAADGTRGKFMCGAAGVYVSWARAFYGTWNEVPFIATRLCDEYGLDVLEIGPMIGWISRCRKAGILTDANTDLPLAEIGSLEFIRTLLANITFRRGFGDALADGTLSAAARVGQEAISLIESQLSYGPQLYITTGLFYCVEPRRPIQQLHEIDKTIQRWLDRQKGSPDSYVTSEVVRAVARRFWGSELAVDFSTYDGKALCAVKIQDRAYAKESLVLCDFSWPITTLDNTEDHVGDPAIESKILFAVTGFNMDEEALYRTGERIFNLQRAIHAREGRLGRQHDVLPDYCYSKPPGPQVFNPECLLPGKDGAPISRKGAVLDRNKFEATLTEYYRLRGWNSVTGLQKRSTLESLGLRDIVPGLMSGSLVDSE